MLRETPGQLLVCLVMVVGLLWGSAWAGPTTAAVTTASTAANATAAAGAAANATVAAANSSLTGASNATLDNLEHKDLAALFRSAAAIGSTPKDKLKPQDGSSGAYVAGLPSLSQVPALVGQYVPAPLTGALANFQTMLANGQLPSGLPQLPWQQQAGQQLPQPAAGVQQLPQQVVFGSQQQQQQLQQLYSQPVAVGQQPQPFLYPNGGHQARMAAAADTRDGLSQYVGTPPPNPYYLRYCDVTDYPRCSCIQPALYSDDGRGNCNVGASKMDLRVWCYVDDTQGNPTQLCPDAVLSVQGTNKGRYWSRIACITP